MIKMKERSKIQKFIRFLKNNHLYSSYYSNIYNYHKNSNIIEVLYLVGQDIQFISGAFPWAGTKEGFEFWENMHRKWLADGAIPCEWVEPIPIYE